jgi:tol-pal system protein YbgF
VAVPQPAPAPAPPPPAAAKIPADRAQYEKASQMFQQGQYGQARKEYQIFLDKYPKSDLADNALFSIGESYYNEKKYQDSIETYQQVRDRFPKGNKVPHAMLKQAAAFEKLGDTTAARILHEQLVEKYPGSPEAQIAEKKLKQ